jgi:transcriptional regulator with XRE-family HTH domain
MKRDVLLRFGDTVRSHRTARGLSQEEFADIAGVHRTYVGMVERGEKNITLRSIEKFSKALGLSIDKLLKMES